MVPMTGPPPATGGVLTVWRRAPARLRRSLAPLVVVSGILWPMASRATTVVAPMTVENLSRAADLVVHGKVESMTPALEGKQVFTYVKVGVTEVIRGASADRSVVLKLYGGRHGGRATFIVGGPSVRLGEEVVLFLKAGRRSAYGLVGLSEGKFEVVRQGRDAAVKRDLRGIQFMRQGDPARLPGNLEELKRIVRAVEG